MHVSIDNRSATPVFLQIVAQVKAAVARGVLRPGDMIPSVRQMAAQALVNPNTVAKAYRDLERDGVISTRRGLGLVVADDAPVHCQEERQTAIRDRLADLVAEARRAGIADKQLREELEDALRRTPRTPETRR